MRTMATSIDTQRATSASSPSARRPLKHHPNPGTPATASRAHPPGPHARIPGPRRVGSNASHTGTMRPRLELVLGVFGLLLTTIAYLAKSHDCEVLGIVTTALAVGMALQRI